MEFSLEIKHYKAIEGHAMERWCMRKMANEQSRPVRNPCLISNGESYNMKVCNIGSFSTAETGLPLGDGQMQNALWYEWCLGCVLHG